MHFYTKEPELIQVGSETLRLEVHNRNIVIWNKKEMPEQ
jgi:hypothetical protein